MSEWMTNKCKKCDHFAGEHSGMEGVGCLAKSCFCRKYERDGSSG